MPKQALQPWLGVTLAVLLAILAGPIGADEPPGPFRDIPPDHWALQAVDRLVAEGLIEGFPDGTFKGKKVVTRYDLAVTVAKILDRVGQIRAAGGSLTPDEMLDVSRLTNEFRSELDLLGVRVDSLERRIGEVETRTEKLDQTLSNIRIAGFHRLENTLVIRPVNFVNYPFRASVNPFRRFRDPGLEPLGQEAFVRFFGRPLVGGDFFENVEAFLELRARISGPTLGNARINFRFSDPPIPGDGIDDFGTTVEDEQRVSVNKAHFKLSAPRLDTRAFSRESMTDFTDPALLFTIDAFDTAPFSGLEFAGNYKKLSYNTSILKAISDSSSLGNNPGDLTDVFAPIKTDEDDFYAMRILYEPYRTRAGGNPNSMVLGLTYTEAAFDYVTPDFFNRVMAADFQFSRETNDSWDLSLVGLRSQGSDQGGDIHGDAFKMDASYSNRDFIGNFKGYVFDREFRTTTAASQFVDTSLGPFRDNFGRGSPTTRGERMARVDLKYDFRDRLGRIFDDFTLSALYQVKDWEDKGPDQNPGRRYRVQALADLTDKTHIEASTERQWDLFADETGTYINNLLVDVRVNDDMSAVGELEFVDDLDAIGPDGQHYAGRRGKFTLNNQFDPRFFMSAYFEIHDNALLRGDDGELFENSDGNIVRPLLLSRLGRVKRNQRNGLDSFTYGGEVNYQFDPDASIRVFAQREEANDDFDPSLDGETDTVVAELSVRFTRALNLRFVHGISSIDLKNRLDDFIVNDFLELLYEPTPKTELRLTYGYDYENPADPFDNGPFLFYRTNKIVQLRAQTDF